MIIPEDNQGFQIKLSKNNSIRHFCFSKPEKNPSKNKYIFSIKYSEKIGKNTNRLPKKNPKKRFIFNTRKKVSEKMPKFFLPR